MESKDYEELYRILGKLKFLLSFNQAQAISSMACEETLQHFRADINRVDDFIKHIPIMIDYKKLKEDR